MSGEGRSVGSSVVVLTTTCPSAMQPCIRTAHAAFTESMAEVRAAVAQVAATEDDIARFAGFHAHGASPPP
jgi:hypothetical protein